MLAFANMDLVGTPRFMHDSPDIIVVIALTHQAVRLRGLSPSERIEKPSLWGQMAKNHC